MPNIQYLGTPYGGWSVDLDYINDGDVIIDAGLGEDISFPLELKKHRDVFIVGIDPTEKSHKYIQSLQLEGFELIECAIAPQGTKTTTLFKNTNPEHVSESISLNHSSVGNDSYEASCISFKDLREKYSNISVIKMDIEGSEYDCLLECVGVKQICVEFHHFCINDKTIEDTNSLIKKMKENGYLILTSNPQKTEMTFIKT